MNFVNDRDCWYVYCLHDFTNNMCRIGKTGADNTNRIKSQTGYYPFELSVERVKFNNHHSAEKYFHKIFKKLKVRADWYRITPDDFDREVRKYKYELNEAMPPKPIGIMIGSEIKYWRVLSDGVEYKCDFVHIHFDNYLLKLRCMNKLVNIELSDANSYPTAKKGIWIKGFASRKNNVKFIQVRFI